MYLAGLVHLGSEWDMKVLPVEGCKKGPECLPALSGPFCRHHKMMFAAAFRFLFIKFGKSSPYFLSPYTIRTLSAADLLHKVPSAIYKVAQFYRLQPPGPAPSRSAMFLVGGQVVRESLVTAILSGSHTAASILWRGRLPADFDIATLVDKVAAKGWAKMLQLLVQNSIAFQPPHRPYTVRTAGSPSVLELMARAPVCLKFAPERFRTIPRIVDFKEFLSRFPKDFMAAPNAVVFDLYHRMDGTTLILQPDVPSNWKEHYLSLALKLTDHENSKYRLDTVVSLTDLFPNSPSLNYSNILMLAVYTRDPSAVTYVGTRFAGYAWMDPSARDHAVVNKAFERRDLPILNALLTHPRVDIHTLAVYWKIERAAKQSTSFLLRFICCPRLKERKDFETFIGLIRASAGFTHEPPLYCDFRQMHVDAHVHRFHWIRYELFRRTLTHHDLALLIKLLSEEALLDETYPLYPQDAKAMLERCDSQVFRRVLLDSNNFPSDTLLRLLCVVARLGASHVISRMLAPEFSRVMEDACTEILRKPLQIAVRFDKPHAVRALLLTNQEYTNAIVADPEPLRMAFRRCSKKLVIFLLTFPGVNPTAVGEEELREAWSQDPSFVRLMMGVQRFEHLLPLWGQYFEKSNVTTIPVGNACASYPISNVNPHNVFWRPFSRKATPINSTKNPSISRISPEHYNREDVAKTPVRLGYPDSGLLPISPGLSRNYNASAFQTRPLPNHVNRAPSRNIPKFRLKVGPFSKQ
ncbi:hypothetical protein HDU67_005725 [Dinochytrium kinnereticum]|nr:hypothetical protein HDU67_005725 [Dinochytrium kinnereticum]